MLEKWEQQRKQNNCIHVSKDIPKLTLRNLLNCLFKESDFDADTMVECIYEIKSTRHDAPFKKSVIVFNKLVSDFIQNRLNYPSAQKDLLDIFIDAYKNEADRELALTCIRDEIKGVLMAGHETAAAAMTWAFYLLAQSKEAQQCIKTETHSILKEHLPTYSDLEKIPYTVATFKEVLRLYPPVYTIPRVAIDDDICDDIHILKKSYIMIPIFHLHRDEKYWDEPNLFKPERFLAKDLSQQSQQAFIPFGFGMRSCIGREFATMEACLCLAMIFNQYQFALPANYVMEIDAANSLWPKQPLQLIIDKKYDE